MHFKSTKWGEKKPTTKSLFAAVVLAQQVWHWPLTLGGKMQKGNDFLRGKYFNWIIIQQSGFHFVLLWLLNILIVKQEGCAFFKLLWDSALRRNNGGIQVFAVFCQKKDYKFDLLADGVS